MKKLILFFSLLIAVGLTAINAQDTWTQKADFGGAARSYAVGFSIGTKGYIGTGYNNGTYYKDFWEYDVTTDAWTQKADFGSTARYGAAGFSIGSKGYLGTGYDNSYKNDFWEYDPVTNAWTQKADFGGIGRPWAVGFSIDSKGYLGTGYDGTSYKDFWEYDPSSNTWTQKADFGGTARRNVVGFSIGDKGYLGTGYNDMSGSIFKDFWEYNPATDTWTQKADFGGTARFVAVGFSIGSKGYLGTGYDGSDKKDFWEYDPAANTWTEKADFGGAARDGAVTFSIGEKGYVGTGIINNNTWYKDFWEYTTGENTVTIPTITSFTPTSGAIGTKVTINGNGFSSMASYNIVYFGATKATVTAASPTTLKVKVPDGVTYDPISVTVAGLTAYSAQPFDVTFDGCSDLTANSFATPTEYTALDYQWSSLISDLDGDGKPDLATSGENYLSWLSVFRNTSTTGTIAFDPRIDIAAPNDWSAPSSDFMSGDMDGDGKIDLVFGTYDETLNWLSVYRNTSSIGSFTFDYTTLITGYDEYFSPVAMGDFDVDGRPDIIYSERYWFDYYPFYIITRNNSTPGNIAFGENYYIPFSEI